MLTGPETAEPDQILAACAVLRDWTPTRKLPRFTLPPSSPPVSSTSNTALAKVYAKDDSLLSRQRTRSEPRKSGGLVKTNSGEICKCTLILDAEWTSPEDSEPSGGEDGGEEIGEEMIGFYENDSDEDGNEEEVEDEEESDDEGDDDDEQDDKEESDLEPPPLPESIQTQTSRGARVAAHIRTKKESRIRPGKTRQKHLPQAETRTTKSRYQETHVDIQETAMVTWRVNLSILVSPAWRVSLHLQYAM